MSRGFGSLKDSYCYCCGGNGYLIRVFDMAALKCDVCEGTGKPVPVDVEPTNPALIETLETKERK
jgi:hypothetical protein